MKNFIFYKYIMSLPPIKDAKNIVPDFMIRKSKKHLYLKDSLFLKMISNKELPQYIKLSKDVVFMNSSSVNKDLLMPININYNIVDQNGKLKNETEYTMTPAILNKHYKPYSLPISEGTEKKSSVPTLPPIGRTYGGSKSTGKTIQYRGKSHKVYMGSKGGHFIYTDASHKHKKYV